MFDEIRIAEAFKFPARLTEADVLELAKRMRKDAKTRERNVRRIEGAGSFDEIETAKQKIWAANKRNKRRNWMTRKLSDAEIAQLAAGWAK